MHATPGPRYRKRLNFVLCTWNFVLGFSKYKTRRPSFLKSFPVVVSRGSHPFPSRTRKLSLLEPMVLRGQLCGRVGSRRDYLNEGPLRTFPGRAFVCDIAGRPVSEPRAVATGSVRNTEQTRQRRASDARPVGSALIFSLTS